MPDREKVIRGLEACNRQSYNGSDCQNCPYYDDEDTAELPFGICNIQDMFDDARDLLKEQEPRVMTLEEVKQHDNQDGCVWFEQPTYNAVAAFVRQDEECTEIISPYLLGEPINHGYMSNTFYAKAWRAWTSHPTEEQQKAVPWEDDDAD